MYWHKCYCNTSRLVCEVIAVKIQIGNLFPEVKATFYATGISSNDCYPSVSLLGRLDEVITLVNFVVNPLKSILKCVEVCLAVYCS